ncbi:MAG: Cys-tRNA(Pro) deacylase [Melioribacteraceae bacterium]|nr:Cys-tRNA(Pro) deacylase [Melioribacteraceae bacterium]MCF8354754.1 Cys-tRNA(Pro) deacylase [Melioribacteraceae bacterium]MCF8394379.1 Cys-tRNA(Pro) deacylase [Melioribacteraceae bacterium]MCF8417525.1 Cys-tRNA(Pro) deacylase [Melioribacteraceae bacterium]
MTKTNAVRILESVKIPHRVIEYNYNYNEIDAVSVAHKINAAPEVVFKSLVAQNSNHQIFVFCIPGNFELNLKKAAAVSESKKIELVKVNDIFNLTGYIRGGCSPIGMKKEYPTFIDETAQLFDKIFVSAGLKGVQIEISPIDLVELISGEFADLI